MQPHPFPKGGEAQCTPNDLPGCLPQAPILAELLCSEPPNEELMRSVPVSGRGNGEGAYSVPSYFDPVILHHPKVIDRLRVIEKGSEPTRDYYNGEVGDGIQPYMRKVVASWMLEVCEEQRCDEAVFTLSVALLDTFLGCTLIKKEHLQLAASVCLLIATKSRQCHSFSPELLSWYTDNSVSPHALRSWELMVLSQLKWDVNIVTATDFVDFFLVRCPEAGLPSEPNKESLLVRRHAITFIALCSTEPRFVGVKPSLIAASAIYTALKGVGREDAQLGKTLANLANSTRDQLTATSDSIEQVITTELSALEQQTCDLTHSKMSPIMSSSCQGGKAYGHSGASSGQNTPTDVTDVPL